jgi:hypothetical protein
MTSVFNVWQMLRLVELYTSSIKWPWKVNPRARFRQFHESQSTQTRCTSCLMPVLTPTTHVRCEWFGHDRSLYETLRKWSCFYDIHAQRPQTRRQFTLWLCTVIRAVTWLESKETREMAQAWEYSRAMVWYVVGFWITYAFATDLAEKCCDISWRAAGRKTHNQTNKRTLVHKQRQSKATCII